jgi:hypothetical protein
MLKLSLIFSLNISPKASDRLIHAQFSQIFFEGCFNSLQINIEVGLWFASKLGCSSINFF